MKYNEKGITIISLVISIIIIIILAGIAVGELSNGGLLFKTKETLNESDNLIREEDEKINSVIQNYEKEWGITD